MTAPGPTGDAGDVVVRPARGLPRGLVVPAAELRERFSRSSGPGGQSVNTADSRVELSWDIRASAVLTDEQRALLLAAWAPRLAGGVLTIVASEQRSQLQNRAAARDRLAALLATAFVPVTPRRATRPSRAARQRRLDAKQRRSQVKTMRGRPRDE